MNRIGDQQTVDREAELRPYQLFMLLLCVYSLIVLMIETFAQLPAEHVIILDAIDNVVCGIFLLDFLISFGHAPKKLEFLKWGWIDLVSSIPVVDVFRAGRIVRVIRILRVLRGIRLARILARYLQHNRADGTFLSVIFVSILLLLLSSVAILQVEQVEGSNIKTPSDALWWAITTMTTVGYGDKYPVTTVGRIIASMVMIAGVGLFGTLSGSVASWILNPTEQRQEVDLDAIQNELAAIRRRLDDFTPETLALDRQRLIDPSNPSPSSAGNPLNVPDLAELISAWPSLSEETRREVRRLMGLPRPFEKHQT